MHCLALVSFRLFCKNLSNLQEVFGQMVYRPPLAENFPYAYGQSQMSRPRGRFAQSKARHGDSLRHQIPAPCPHSPLTGFTLIGA